MNLASDFDMKECLGYSVVEKMSDYGAGRLLKILRRAGLNDTEMSIVSCQALCNLFSGCSADDIWNLMYEDDLELLRATLDELVETAQEALEDDEEVNEKNSNDGYSDFLNAAGSLKEMLQICPKRLNNNNSHESSLYEELEVDYKSK